MKNVMAQIIIHKFGTSEIYLRSAPHALGRKALRKWRQGNIQIHNNPLGDCYVIKILEKLVLLGRIELPTSPLPRECSTSELQQHCGRLISFERGAVQEPFLEIRMLCVFLYPDTVGNL